MTITWEINLWLNRENSNCYYMNVYLKNDLHREKSCNVEKKTKLWFLGGFPEKLRAGRGDGRTWRTTARWFFSLRLIHMCGIFRVPFLHTWTTAAVACPPGMITETPRWRLLSYLSCGQHHDFLVLRTNFLFLRNIVMPFIFDRVLPFLETAFLSNHLGPNVLVRIQQHRATANFWGHDVL